jgi:hypothetical protein
MKNLLMSDKTEGYFWLIYAIILIGGLFLGIYFD